MWRSAPLFVYQSRDLVDMSAFTVIQDDSAMVVLATYIHDGGPFLFNTHSLTFLAHVSFANAATAAAGMPRNDDVVASVITCAA